MDTPYSTQPATSAETSTQTFRYAGFWVRFGASIIDAIILGIIGRIFFGDHVTAISSGSVSVAYNGWQLLVPLVYVLVFWIWLSATPGKLVLKLIIVEEDGKKLSPAKAIIRYLGYILSALVFFLGFIWIGFDKKKQGWHDKIAGTYVVRK